MIAPIDQSHAPSWIPRWFSQQITHCILKPTLYNRWCFRRWWGVTADETRPSYRVWERRPEVTWCTMFPLSTVLVDSGHIIFWSWPVSGNEVSAYLMCFHCVWLSQYLRLWSEFKTGASYIQKTHIHRKLISHGQECRLFITAAFITTDRVTASAHCEICILILLYIPQSVAHVWETPCCLWSTHRIVKCRI